MRKRLMSAAALAAVLLLPIAAQAPRAQGVVAAPAAVSARARVIVKYRADSPLLKKQAMTAAGRRNLQVQALGDRIGLALTSGRGITARSSVVFADGISSSDLAARLSAQSDVEYAVVDGRKHIVAVPNDTYYASGPALGASSGGPVVGQWYLKPPGAAGSSTTRTAPSAINAEQAWDVLAAAGVTGSSVVVAVIDTGVRFDHVDLQGGNVLPGYDMVSADTDGSFTTANDGNGRDSDASDPGDWVTQAESSGSGPLSGCAVEATSSWHGTQTLGLIGAATNNGAGIASVGQGQVKVMPVRALGKCGGYDSDIVAAMYYAANAADSGASTDGTGTYPVNPTPAKVISMSLGGTGSCSALYQDAMAAMTAAGVTVVAAAGNESATSADTPGNCPGVIAVAALRSLGDKVGFSNIGTNVSIAAPGGNCGNNDGTAASPDQNACLYPIMSTSNSGATTPVAASAGGSIYSDGYADPSLGTSFSTPLVAGTAALMLAVQPSLTPAEIKALLQSSARPFPNSGSTLVTGSTVCTTTNGSTSTNCYCPNTAPLVCGAGMLDAHAAVLAALGVQARITVDTATPTAGQPVSLSSNSLVNGNQTIASYAWTITSAGGTGATITGAANASSVTVTPTGAGTFTVQLVVTDALGVTSTASTSVAVAATSSGGGPTTGPSSTGSSSGGGGAIGAGWLLLLLAAVAALAAEERLQRRRRATIASVPATRRG
ncbi:MAG TPA: S8 family serine peptidase [Caldimonas sp.]|nr:S8 family serine peptidase [Caldimonas sp.]